MIYQLPDRHFPVAVFCIAKMGIDKLTEFIDILNENGVMTGQSVSRDEVHSRGLWHRAIICAIVNSDNKVLLQQRAFNKEKYPGLWDLSVAGHIIAGDDSVSTVIRETNEEVGFNISRKITLNDFCFITSFRSIVKIGDFIENQFYDFFILKDFNLKELQFNDNEVIAAKWCDYAEIRQMLKNNKLHPRTEWITPLFKYINGVIQPGTSR
jgi:isopentenyldiphosphate isomerase